MRARKNSGKAELPRPSGGCADGRCGPSELLRWRPPGAAGSNRRGAGPPASSSQVPIRTVAGDLYLRGRRVRPEQDRRRPPGGRRDAARRRTCPPCTDRLPRPAWVDVVLAIAVTALGAVEIVVGQIAGPYWATVPSVLLFGVPLLWRRQFPWTALLVVFGTIFGLHLSGASQYNYLASVASALLVMAAFAGAVELGQAVAGLVLAAAALSVSALEGLSGIIWGVGLLVGAWAAGRALRARRLLIDELARTTEELRRSREAHAQAAVADERTRIARELHDVIAHAVSVMVVQAGAADRDDPGSIPSGPSPADRVGEDCGRQALARSAAPARPAARPPTTATTPSSRPQPGLADVPDLVAASARPRGLAVRPRRGAAGRAASPPGVELAAFRDRAGGAHQRAQARRPGAAGARCGSTATDRARRRGRNDGRRADRPVDGGGHGLVGMRERAALYGGTLSSRRRAPTAGSPCARACRSRRWRPRRDPRACSSTTRRWSATGSALILEAEPDIEVRRRGGRRRRGGASCVDAAAARTSS